MPNHVHAVVWPMPGNHVERNSAQLEIVHRSKAANQRLNRTGEFWQKESFDHWIRDDVECARLVAYVENNPVKALLCKSPAAWKWSSAHERQQPS